MENNEYKFVYLWSIRYGGPQGWYLEIKTLKELMAYQEVSDSHLISIPAWDLFMRDDFEKVLSGEGMAGLSGIDLYFAATARRVLEEKTHVSMIDVIKDTASKVYGKMAELILQGNTIYINQNGGYMLDSCEYRKMGLVKSSELVFPQWTENDIKISCWKNGQHYYAHIGVINVVIDGKQKWDSYSEAKEAAMSFLDKLNMRENENV